MTFRRRLTLVAAGAVAVAIVVASAIIFFVVRDQLRDELDSGLEDLASGSTLARVPLPAGQGGRNLSLSLPAHRGAGRGHVALALPAARLGSTPGYGQLINARGKPLHARNNVLALPVSDATREVAAGTHGPFFSDVDVDGVHLRVLTTQVAPGRALQVARSAEDVDATLGRLTLVLAIVSLGGVGLATLLGWAVSRAAVAPVGRLTEAAEHVALTHDLGQRIAEDGRNDELGRLAASVNAMLAALDRAVGAQRRLMVDASHELRTPLTSLRTNVEVLARPNGLPDGDRERLLHDVVVQLEELGALIEDVMDLAREEEPRSDEEPIRLDRVAADALGRARRRVRDRSFSARLEPCLVFGVRARLDRALDNLLDNAAKWSPPGGAVEVTTTAAGELIVRDHGPGIDPVDAPLVFDRFHRAASARGMPGSGLGLAIVRQVAEAHGGSVSAEQAPGGGALLRVRLPVAAPSADYSGPLS